MITPSPWRNFTVEELSCRCGCGRMDMNADFMERVVKLRLLFDRPMNVTSGFRCPEWDAKVGSSHQPGKGPHTTGHAIDVGIYGPTVGEYLDAARKVGGFTGFGLDQKEGGTPESRFIHLDDLTESETGITRPNWWTYGS